jgi:uncharacterized tellurite resistance protein B-like protein
MSKSQAVAEIVSRFDGMQCIAESEKEAKVYEIEYLFALMLVAVARSDGHIDETETAKMLELVGEYFHLRSATSLGLLSRAVKQLAEDPDLTQLLRDWGDVLTTDDKEDIAVMMLKIVAADGTRDTEEMAMLNRAADIIEIPPNSLHGAFRRFYEEVDHQTPDPRSR